MSALQEARINKMLDFPYGSYLMIRLEYVIICGDELEAKILRLIEMRMEDERKRVYRETLNAAPKGSVQLEHVLEVTTDVWVAISHRTFMYDLYGTVKSENTLKRAIKSLKEKGFISIRDELTGRYDAPEYQLNVSLVQTELNKLLKEGKRGYQKLTPSNSEGIKSRPHQNLIPSEGHFLIPSEGLRVSKFDTNSRNNNSNNNIVEEKESVASPSPDSPLPSSSSESSPHEQEDSPPVSINSPKDICETFYKIRGFRTELDDDLARERRVAAKIAAKYSQEQFVTAYTRMKADTYWASKQPALAVVARHLAEYLHAPDKQHSGTPLQGVHATSASPIDMTQDFYRQDKKQAKLGGSKKNF